MLPTVISVLVPFHNSEATLQVCIESLLAQKEVGCTFEVILINNNSTDSSTKIASSYPSIRLLHEDKPGAYAARNTGIRNAKSPILAFTDSDCIVHHHWLKNIRESMEDNDLAALVGRCRYPKEASLALRLLGAYEWAKIRYVINHASTANHFAYTNNMAVRACVFNELGLFLEWQRAADTELVHRMEAERPKWRYDYNSAMQVTHLEFLRCRDRSRRLALYTSTNTKIPTFKELSLTQKLAAIGCAFSPDRPPSR